MKGIFLTPETARYLEEMLPAVSPTMRRIEEEVQREGHPAVMADTGALLTVLVAASGGRRVLEVGTNLGYGALWLAEGLAEDGRIDTIEISPEIAQRARAHFAAAGLAERIHVHVGAALDVLPTLTPGYDLIFLDAVKEELPQYLEHARRLLRPGGILATDNVLWSGRVWDESNHEPSTEGVRAFTRLIRADGRFLSATVPLGDGLEVAVLRP